MRLPRFLANIVRKDASPEIVTTRNFDELGSVLEGYAQEIEKADRLIASLIKSFKRLIPPALLGRGNIWDVRSFGTIAVAITGLGSRVSTLYITDTQTISTATVVPSNISIEVLGGGSFTSSNASQITFNGPFKAVNAQVFSGDLVVVFKLGSIDYTRPEWFGADSYGATDSTSAIQKCLNTVLVNDIADATNLGKYAPDIFFSGKYKILLPGLLMSRRCSFIGLDARRSSLEYGSLTGSCITIGYTALGGTSVNATGTAGANTLVLSNATSVVDGSIIVIPSTMETHRAKSVSVNTVTLYEALNQTYTSVVATKIITTTDNIGVDGYTTNIYFKNLKIEGALSLGDPISSSVAYNGSKNVGVYSPSITHRLTFVDCVVQRFFKGISAADSITQRMSNTVIRVCDKGMAFPYVAQSAANMMAINCGITDNRVGIESLPIGSTLNGCVFEGNVYSGIGAVTSENGTTINAMGDNCRLIGNWFEGANDRIRGDFYNCIIIGPGVMSSAIAGLFSNYTFPLESRNTFVQISPYGGDVDPVNLLTESRLGRIALKGGVGVQGTGGLTYAAYMDALALFSNTDLHSPRNVKQQRISYFDKAPSITVGKRIAGDLAPDITGSGVYLCVYPLLGYGSIGSPSQSTDGFTGASGNKFISLAYNGSGFEAEDNLLLSATATTTGTGTINLYTVAVASATNIIAGSRIVFSGTLETLTVDSIVGVTLTCNKKLKNSYTATTITIYHPVTIVSDTAITSTITGTISTNTATVVSTTNLQIGYRIKIRTSNEQLTIRSISGTTLTFDSSLGETYAEETFWVVPVKLYTTTATGNAGTTSLTLASGVGVVAGDILKLPLEDIVVSSITGTAVTTATNLVNNVTAGACNTTKIVIAVSLSYSYTGLTNVLLSDLCEWRLIQALRDVDGTNLITGNTRLDGRTFITSDLNVGSASDLNLLGTNNYITLTTPQTGVAEWASHNIRGRFTADGVCASYEAHNGANRAGYMAWFRYGADNTSKMTIGVFNAGSSVEAVEIRPTEVILKLATTISNLAGTGNRIVQVDTNGLMSAANVSAGLPRVLNTNTTAAGNILTGEDNLMTYAVPADTLATNGDSLNITAGGTFAVATVRLKAYFGAQMLFDTGALVLAGVADWGIECDIVRTGATTQKAIVRFNSSFGTLLASCDYTTPAETLSGAVTFKLTGEATLTNDIVQEMLKVRFEPNA